MISPMKRSVRRGGDPLDSLADSVRTLSRLLTRERERLPESYMRDHALRQAYRDYFLPANLPKVHVPLGELASHPAALVGREHLHVLDIGTGPGTSMLGLLSYFSQREQHPAIEFTAVDTVSENLREAEALFAEHAARYPCPTTIRTMRCDAEGVSARLTHSFDLVIFSNVLNELFPEDPGRVVRRADLVGRLMRDQMEEDGSCIIIEPALRESSRDLLQVRDRLLDDGFNVYSPCLVQKPCPALAGPKDWCHEERPWVPTERVREIDARTGLRKDSLKFSYVVLRKDGRSLTERTGADAMRVVSEPLVSKGKREYYVCGPSGRKLVVRLDKDASNANGPFGSLHRGDIVRFGGVREEDRRLLVTKETAVTVAQVAER
jgi:ribosomal protein RSM22 (predicted rRNA methylase)